MTVYAARVVERDGTVVRTMVHANFPGQAVEEVNAFEQFTFAYPKKDPAGASGQGDDVRILTREVQILRDGDVYLWGVPLRRSRSSAGGEVVVSCVGTGWHLGGRNIDAPITNLLVNPGFETGLYAPWVPAAGTTTLVIASPRRLGSNAVRLTSAFTGSDHHLRQTLTGVYGGDIGLYLTLAAHFLIESWTGPAVDSRGLFVAGLQGAVVRNFQVAEIDDATPRGVWQRLEVGIWIPPGETWDIDVRGYAAHGVTVWDAFQLVAMESLSVDLAGTDVAVMAGRVVDFIQDPAKGKDDLFIGTSTPVAGRLLSFPRAWQYADHHVAESVIGQELAPLGFDWSIEFDDTGVDDVWTKTFTSHAPRMGVDRSGTVTLSFGVPGANLASYDLDDDGSSVETDVTMLGEGDGPDREEGRATDTSELDGLVLQGIHSAPTGATIDILDPLADDKLDRGKRISRLLVVTTKRSPTLVGLLRKGDVVAANIVDGDEEPITGNWRIVRREHTFRTESLRLTLNEDFGYRGGVQIPDPVRAIVGVGGRVRAMERETTPTDRPVKEERVTIDFTGQLFATSAETEPEYPVRVGGQLVATEVLFGQAGTSSTTLRAYMNGAALGSDIVVLAGVTTLSPYLGNLRIPRGARLKVRCVTPGAAAAAVSVTFTMKG